MLVNAAFVCSVLWQLVRHVDWQELRGKVSRCREIARAWVGGHCPGGVVAVKHSKDVDSGSLA